MIDEQMIRYDYEALRPNLLSVDAGCMRRPGTGARLWRSRGGGAANRSWSQHDWSRAQRSLQGLQPAHGFRQHFVPHRLERNREFGVSATWPSFTAGGLA